eukprot:768346-Hanusia_phi.AAC.5
MLNLGGPDPADTPASARAINAAQQVNQDRQQPESACEDEEDLNHSEGEGSSDRVRAPEDAAEGDLPHGVAQPLVGGTFRKSFGRLRAVPRGRRARGIGVVEMKLLQVLALSEAQASALGYHPQ